MVQFILALALAAAPSGKGAIAVKSFTNGARVFVDGDPVGSVPAVLRNVKAGSHTIKVVRLGYLSFEESVTVAAGKTTEVQADLLPISGVLKISSPVKGTQLLVDGKNLGALPYEGEVQVGKRTIEVRKDGYQTYKQVLSVAAGNDYVLTATLQKTKAVSAGDEDLPLVAIAPKRKGSEAKKGNDDIPLEDIPLAIPVATKPRPEQPLGVTKPIPEPQEDAPVYEKWWFWTAAGGVVAAAIIIPVAIASSSSAEPRSFLPGLSGPWVLSGAR